MRKIFDYDRFPEADYRKDFWSFRDYENNAERLALAKLLPAEGSVLIDIGAGFGRLADVFRPRFSEVVLFDVARSLLNQAKSENRFHLVRGNLFELPFPDKSFSAAVMVRVLHHVEDVPAALAEVRRVLAPGGKFILEYANKRNLLEIIRFVSGRKNCAPFSREPSKRHPLYYNFHPAYINDILRTTGFVIQKELSVSNFRLEFLKKVVATRFLSKLEDRLQEPLGSVKLSPSVFVLALRL